MPRTTRAAIPLPDQLRVCVMAEVCPASVRRFLVGQPVRPSTERRIRRALAALALPVPTPTT